MTGGETTLWSVAFAELLPVSPQQTAKKWDRAEHQRFLELLKQHGRNFQQIADGLPDRNESVVQEHYYKGLKKAIDDGKAEYCGCPCDETMLVAENRCTYCQRFDKPCTAGNVRQCAVAPLCSECKRHGSCVDEAGKLSACQTVCQLCVETGHTKQQCSLRERQQCSCCGSTGHRLGTCKQLIAETGLSKPDFKKLFFSSVLYHPECTDEQVARKLKKYNLEKEPNLFKELRTEMRACCTKLLKCYPCYTEAAKQSQGEDYHNLPGTALSLLVQTAEKRCIVALYKYWDDKKVRVGALIHDGLHVAIDDATDKHLKPASDYIYKHTKFRVQLEYKQWEPHPA